MKGRTHSQNEAGHGRGPSASQSNIRLGELIISEKALRKSGEGGLGWGLGGLFCSDKRGQREEKGPSTPPKKKRCFLRQPGALKTGGYRELAER